MTFLNFAVYFGGDRALSAPGFEFETNTYHQK